MLTLYVRTGCPYCAMALAKIDDLGLEVKQLNVAEKGIAEELIEKGGKKQEPYLIDDETGISMYESAKIVDYLDEHYGDETSKSVKEESKEQEPPGVCPA